MLPYRSIGFILAVICSSMAVPLEGQSLMEDDVFKKLSSDDQRLLLRFVIGHHLQSERITDFSFEVNFADSDGTQFSSSLLTSLLDRSVPDSLQSAIISWLKNDLGLTSTQLYNLVSYGKLCDTEFVTCEDILSIMTPCCPFG